MLDLPDNTWVPPKVAAPILGYTVRGLAGLRERGVGPRFAKPTPRTVRYQVADLRAWMQTHARETVA